MDWLQIRFIWFVLYSIIGWIWEVVICSVPQKRFINRGFLNGPYCPIYGAGALLIVEFLGDMNNPFLIFITGAALTAVLEYLTSWVMEKFFHARWWDYSDKFLNLNGRICFMGICAFGTMSVLAVKFIHPPIAFYMSNIPDKVTAVLSLVLFALMLMDTVYTLARFADFESKLQELTEKINISLASAAQQRKAIADKLHETEIYTKLSESYVKLYKRFNAQERRMLKAFPKFSSKRYNEALQKFRQHVLRKNDDDSIE